MIQIAVVQSLQSYETRSTPLLKASMLHASMFA